MECIIKSSNPTQYNTPCLVVGVWKKDLTKVAASIDKATNGLIQRLLAEGDLDDKPGSTLLIPLHSQIKAKRILLVQCGEEGKVDRAQFNKILNGLSSAIKGAKLRQLTSTISQIEVSDSDNLWKIEHEIIAISHAQYQFNLPGKKQTEKSPLKKISILIQEGEVKKLQKGADAALSLAKGIQTARDLGNLPGNICTPTYLAQHAQQLDNEITGLKTTILSEAQMQRLKMGSLLSVSRGSAEPAKLIIMEYKGKKAPKKGKPIVLVGKGLTFDAGGISLKPSPTMDEMKYDMCGGASVIGALQAVAEMELPIHVIGIVPSSENLPDGKANKPGDVVTSMSGQTIEILNTDAEGRLILCDAITYARRFKPEVIIDVATLTGAVIVALGRECSAVLGNDQELINQLIKAGEESGDRCWQLPLWEEYGEQLKSNFADMANIGSRDAGSITASSFLSRFTKGMRWAHLDIAGTAWISGTNKGSTGKPVSQLVQFIRNQCQLEK